MTPEEKYRDILDNISDGVYWLNADGYFSFVNQAIINRSGISREKFHTLHFFDLVDPDYHDQVKKNFQMIMNGGDGTPYELKYKDSHGRVKTVEVRSKPIKEGSKVVGVLGISRDITERTQAEEALRRSEEKYHAILENASDAIFIADFDGNLGEVNKKAEELLGYSREDLLEMNYTQLHPMTELERTIAAFKIIVERRSGFLNDGFILRKDGNIVPVDITGSVIEYAGQKVIQGSFRDISDQKRAKDILERMVEERTAELDTKNKSLVKEIKERNRAEAGLRKKTNEMQIHSAKLEELNAALKVLLKQREEDRTELEEKVLTNVKHLLVPHLETLKKKKLDRDGIAIVEILESNLKNIISPFSHKLSSKYMNLTPSEIKIANLIRDGKSTKEIAGFMRVSANAVNHHRHHIREKLSILAQKINLRSYLSTLL